MRQHVRYPTSIGCLIRLRESSPVSAVITDLSVGGAAVETTVDVDGATVVALAFFHEGVEHTFPCAVRHTRTLWARSTLHLKFNRLSGEQHDALEKLVLELARARASVRSPSRPRFGGRPN